MSAFDSAADDLTSAVLEEFGESVTYRRAGTTDAIVTAIPADQMPEDGVPGQFTVRVMRAEDVPDGPAKGDTVIIGADEYRIFAVKRRESDALARVFLAKDK